MRKIRWVGAVLVIILTLFITGSVWTEEKEEKREITEEIITKNNHEYDTKTNFACGNVDITVITHCIYEEALPPFCVSDKQFILLKLNDIVKKINSSSPKYEGEKYTFLKKELVKNKKILQYLITQINCYKSRSGKWYIEFEYYRGGNCEQCEYYELYDMYGNLIGVDKDKIIYPSFLSQIVKKYEKFFDKLGLIYVKSQDVKLQIRR